MTNTPPALHRFITDIERLIETGQTQLPEHAARRMSDLVARDDWLPDRWAQPHPQHYQQYLLHADADNRFSIVSFVWGPGQMTPIHNHTVWGIIGVLRGAECSQRYEIAGDAGPRKVGQDEWLNPGSVDIVSPQHGDIHRVRNAYSDRVSISIHLYGGNIGLIERSVFDPQTGAAKTFVSGYSKVLDGE